MKIISVASAIPETATNNAVIEARLKLDRGWIERRTGILKRPTAPPETATSDLAVSAGARALEEGDIDRSEIGLLLLATSTPDHLLPPTAPLVAYRLGLERAGAIDLAGACSGFLYAVILGGAYGQAMRRPVLVVAANLLTRRVNQDDPNTASIFSDGAGAVVLVPADPPHVLGSYLGADGSAYNAIGIPAGGTREGLTPAGLIEGRHLMTMRKGPSLFKNAVNSMAFAGKEAMKVSGLQAAGIDWWIPHQANVRLTQDAGVLLNIPPERTISVVEQYGNSSAATIPIAMAHGVESGKLRRGQTLLLTSVGAGMINAGLVLRW
jgi:3-oxoacyl-[acyl-carrier-protein] synthase-3